MKTTTMTTTATTTAADTKPVVRYRTTSSEEDTGEFATLEEALAACRGEETVTVVAYHPGEGSPFWAAVEAYSAHA